MKKIISLILVIAIILLVGCSDVENAEADTQINYIQDEGMFEIYVDEETGVNYISYYRKPYERGGITVRLNADGTPYVSGVNGNE